MALQPFESFRGLRSLEAGEDRMGRCPELKAVFGDRTGRLTSSQRFAGKAPLPGFEVRRLAEGHRSTPTRDETRESHFGGDCPVLALLALRETAVALREPPPALPRVQPGLAAYGRNKAKTAASFRELSCSGRKQLGRGN